MAASAACVAAGGSRRHYGSHEFPKTDSCSRGSEISERRHASVHGRFLRRLFRKEKPRRERRLLFLDDDPRRAEVFLSENPQAVWVETVDDCLAKLARAGTRSTSITTWAARRFVDTNQVDCGMEVIRWLCKEPRPHLRETFFFVHTHNSVAGLLMVLQMRSTGYNAEFRPFGFDPARWLASDELLTDEPPTEEPCGEGPPEERPVAPSSWRRWLQWIRPRKSEG